MSLHSNLAEGAGAVAQRPPPATDLDRPAPSPVPRGKLKKRELAALTSQLAIMLRSGVDVASALKTIAGQSRREGQSEIVYSLHADVMRGQPFSSALRPYSDSFGATYIASVAAGEASGRLPDVLGQLAQLQQCEMRLKNTVRTLLAYPILLSAVSGVVLAALLFFVLPQFADIFDQFDTPLPVITQVLIGFSNELVGRCWLWGALLALGVAGALALRWSEFGRRIWDQLALRVFLVRDVTRSLLIGRVCRLLGLMIDSGVPLIESLGLARSAVDNSLYRELFFELEDNVVNGRGLGSTLLESEFVPPSAAEMLLTAERTGNLGSVTQMIGEHYLEEGESKLREIVTFLEPAITVVMGVVVAMIVMAVMFPMFDMAVFAQGH